MGVAHGPLRKRYSGKGRAVPERLPVDPSSFFASLENRGSGGRDRTGDLRIMIPPQTVLKSLTLLDMTLSMSHLCRKDCAFSRGQLGPVIVRGEQVPISVQCHDNGCVPEPGLYSLRRQL